FFRATLMNAMKTPLVYLVGGGPGDPGLLTLRGAECLARADVVLYDRLVNPALLDLAPPEAERIYVGKSPRQHTLSQDAINQVLIDRAQNGQTVVRLHGGDAFVFGRGGEEAEMLAAAGIPYKIVPGITSAIAAPAFAGIPITHRDYAASFAVVAGRRRADAGQPLPPIPDAGTLVFLMPVSNLPAIVERLLAEGHSPDTPAALVHRGSLPQQRTVTGVLADIVNRAKCIEAPAAFIVGPVVRLQKRLAWFERLPLFGKRILITRPRAQTGELSRRLAGLGAEVLLCPVIKIAPPLDTGPLETALRQSGEYDWVVFTSVNGVKYVWERLRALGRDARAFGRARLAAVGPATAAALAEIGLMVDYLPEAYTTGALAVGLPVTGGERVLLPRAEIVPETLAKGLAARGAQVTEVTAYRVLPGQLPPEFDLVEMLAAGGVDVVTLASGSTVRALVALLGGPEQAAALLAHSLVACIGPVTASTAREMGLRVDITADVHTVAGLVDALLVF
ncbi:MAG: uroporphyrinogen-III C-methyltransferase, partial [Anaerolineales bacterium]